ncbi:hypothetical protein [Glycomyces artemisiae]|uniref:hypothetical protein n=1 Tax=Glycomyces artemisiae TaxID=1076443 RepID=UPI0011B1F753|nr:hypothetical protein [Glycomyces artemisiae]
MSLRERRAASARHSGGRWLRVRAVALAALFAAAAPVAPAAPAAAQDACAGVTVVVDFGELDDLRTGCAADPADGLDALAQAGFAVTEVAAIRGMVCSIDALPATDCGASPPADAYWSYWHANAGDEEWTYSMVGGADATPDAGDVEGWAFGDGSAPPALAPGDAVASEAGSEPESGGSSYTWIIAVAVLAVIGVLAAWRLRQRRA